MPKKHLSGAAKTLHEHKMKKLANAEIENVHGDSEMDNGYGGFTRDSDDSSQRCCKGFS